MSRIQLPSDKLEITLEDFANWILQLDDDIKKKQIWFIDLGSMYRGKPINFEYSPSKSHVALEEIFEE